MKARKGRRVSSAFFLDNGIFIEKPTLIQTWITPLNRHYLISLASNIGKQERWKQAQREAEIDIFTILESSQSLDT